MQFMSIYTMIFMVLIKYSLSLCPDNEFCIECIPSEDPKNPKIKNKCLTC